MKQIYVPGGTTEKHENVFADALVVKGRLIVTGVIRAKQIHGGGMIEAQRIIADSIVADTLEAEHISAKKVIAKKIFCETVTASIGIVATDYIEAHSVKAARLTSSISKIDETEASEIVSLTPKKRGFIATIIFSWLQERFMFWRHNRLTEKNAAVYEPEYRPKDPAEVEFDKMIESYRDKCLYGAYRLVIEPEEAEAA